ncbi:hypothetical protein [Laspinema olomoucense]|uniref:hypothetical protein n=1 Tax=Laspinema olomoucense TaxID=3231600 RepID=UPI0021BACF8E|nr:hypothetical protein [Laspinema sp. D3d]
MPRTIPGDANLADHDDSPPGEPNQFLIFPAGDSWEKLAWVFRDRSPGCQPTQSDGFKLVSPGGDGMAIFLMLRNGGIQ